MARQFWKDEHLKRLKIVFSHPGDLWFFADPRRCETRLDVGPAFPPAPSAAAASPVGSPPAASPIIQDTAQALSGCPRGRLLWYGANP